MGCSDRASLRGVSEMVQRNGYLGTVHILPTMPEFELYNKVG
jgi:hypothetical protein